MSHTLSPTTPIDAIIFDCDGTLSHIEGIDELAKNNGVGEKVIQLTAQAMGHIGMNPDLYQQRLDLVLPTSQQIASLGQTYFEHLAPDLLSVLEVFKTLGKSLYIVSAGLYPAVADFGKRLGIPETNIFAVDIYFDDAGNYMGFDKDSPMVFAEGKRWVVEELKKRHAQLAFVGDGLTDYATHDVVARFIGYGGAYYRRNIEELCQYYISLPSMAPLLSFCLTEAEIATLNPAKNP